ncbi:MAG: HAD family hydrolase [Spirochaetaceae bacterium]|nr:HAD family hydrolase [Spirochaetaceae bacterium]
MSADPRQTLYVSDLDGTLLRSDGSLSAYSARTLNRLIGEGMHFTVASARGCGPIRNALGDLRLRLPVIATNGAYVSDLATGRHLAVQALPPATARDLCALFDGHEYSPFLFTTDGSADRFYYTTASLRNDGMRRFHRKRETRQDPRLRRLDDLRQGLDDQVVRFTLIDALPPIHNLEREVRRRHGSAVQIHCHENYDALWYHLTVLDAHATKDHGAAALKRVLDVEHGRLVVFGDQVNDPGLFRVADEACAVAGAPPELARHATAVIGSNDDDAVARWLEHRWRADR